MIVSKTEFAKRLGVGQSAVSNAIARKQLTAPALVERDGKILVDEDLARAQLRRRLDVEQRIRNGRARLGGDGADDPIVAKIKVGRLRQIELANARAEQEAAERAGKLIAADDARLEFGRVAARMVALVEGALPAIADQIAADVGADRRAILIAAHKAWRAIRGRLAVAEGEAAASLPEQVESAA